MNYELFDVTAQRQLVADQLRASEQQHYTEVLRKLANPNDRNIIASANDSLAKIETGVAALREELARLDAAGAAAAPAVVEAKAPHLPPGPAGATVVERPAPSEVTSAVAGGTVSQPQNDTPTP